MFADKLPTSNNANLLRAPRVAWPTVALSVAILVGFPAVIVFALTGLISVSTGGLLAFFFFYAAFTPMHEASHRAIARPRWVNEVIGRIMALLLTGTFPAFRHLHLMHHKATNDPVHDPDAYVSSGPWWSVPWRCATVDFNYHRVYTGADVWPTRSRLERAEVVASGASLLLIIGALSAAGYAYEVFVLWVIPVRIAVMLLTFGFDYLPHWPHEATFQKNRFRSARIIASRWLTPLLFGHNYHLIHHLYPAVPFYAYGRVFEAKREELAAKGARIDVISLRPTSLRPTSGLGVPELAGAA